MQDHVANKEEVDKLKKCMDELLNRISLLDRLLLGCF
jgi:hypothetical protein